MGEVLRHAVVRRVSSRPVVAVLAVTGIVAGVLVGTSGLETVSGCGTASDYYPSQTAEDWVTYADHVVVASPVREAETGRSDYTKGSVRYDDDRTVTFRTDHLLWSSRHPAHRMGDSFAMVAPGWRVYRSGTRVKRTATDAPRLELGHTYLLALRWTDGRWTVLGEGASVPFDDHTGDQGEWCGRVLSKEDVSRGERFSRKDDHSLERALLGQNEAAVTRELARAERKAG
ncbi:hypothetical protein [Streptomyces sp. L2]|uniref:hypothetical protein n=1 Tax=Streptomyces sp. L2 TaxID=2162665 RepID=UPI0010111E47|nr:hypothetical protein [Streptomyces sp. L2]